MRIQALDLSSGLLSTIFQAENGSWIYFVTVSPNEKLLVTGYTPNNGNGHQLLYTLPLDGSVAPQLLFIPPSPDDEYFQPEFSPDGKYLYFTHVNFQLPPKSSDQHYPIYEVFRLSYPNGQPEKLDEQAFWPRVSGDGARLAFVSLNPIDGSNKLYLANADGTDATEVQLSGANIPTIIDAPIFSPDEQSILFSAVTPTQSSHPTWLERLLGITIASAHTVPSDWWSVPLAGGTPTQLTHIAQVGLFASISPDKKHIASFSGAGLFVMNPDGTNLTVLLNDMGGVPGTVSWIP
jgi:Tol biopolymer transport system component